MFCHKWIFTGLGIWKVLILCSSLQIVYRQDILFLLNPDGAQAKLQEQELQTIRRQISKQGNNGNYNFGVGNLRNNYIATLAYMYM